MVIFRYKFSSTGRAASNMQPAMAKPERILGVDGGAEIRGSLREHFRKYGCRSTLAADEKER